MLNPLVHFWLFLATCAVLYRYRRKKAGRFFMCVALAEMFLFSVTPLPVWMVKNLEDRYPVYNPPLMEKDINVMVLGAGHVNDSRLTELHKLSDAAESRLAEGIRLHHRIAGSHLVLSGRSDNSSMTQAEVAARAAIALGVKSADTLMLTTPATTWEEAAAYKKRFGISKKLILVTSATHMPRAMETFRKAGLDPIAAPASFLIKQDQDDSVYNWKPYEGKLAYTRIAAHEYFGMLYYRWFKD